MSGKELSEALTDVSEEKICGAMGAYRRKRRTVMLRVASIAAMLAIVLGFLFWPRNVDGYVVAPGVVKVYAYDLQTREKRELEKGVKLPANKYGWVLFMNAYAGLPIEFEIEEPELAGMEVTIQIQTPHGNFLGDHHQRPDKYWVEGESWRKTAKLGRNFTIDNGETIYWENRESEDDWGGTSFPDGVAVDAIILADGIIVGYVALEIWMMEDINSGVYGAKLLEAIYFPKVDGQFQNVTEEYIRGRIEKIRR